MGHTTHCCGLHPRGAVILIAIVDIVTSLICFLLSSLALGDLHKVSALIERDMSDIDSQQNESHAQAGITEFTHLHGQVVLVLLGSLISLFLASGLFLGVTKDWECPIKAWLVNGCVMILLGSISTLVLIGLSGHLVYSLLFLLFLIRAYQLWVVLHFLRESRFTAPAMARSASTERLHNV